MSDKDKAIAEYKELIEELKNHGVFDIKSYEQFLDKIEWLYRNAQVLDGYNKSEMFEGVIDLDYKDIQITINFDEGIGVYVSDYVEYWLDDDESEPLEFYVGRENVL